MTTENKIGAFLEITMQVNESDRAAAAAVYSKYRKPFLDTITGAVSKQLLVRQEDVQVLSASPPLLKPKAISPPTSSTKMSW